LEAESDFELWYLDGVRFDLLPVSRGMWHRKGKRLFIPTPGKNVRVAVCGAYRYPNGPFRFAHGPKSVNTGLFLQCLHQLVRRSQQTGKRIVLVLDNARYFRKAKRAQAELGIVARWVRPFWLPCYTSEKLNRIEGIWGHLKDDYFSRMLTPNRELFYEAAVKLLRRLHKQGTLQTLFGSHLPK
jgi:transposase